MLHTKYQGSRPYGFSQEGFHVFPYISLYKACVLGHGYFWLQGDNSNKLCRGPLGDATYQILKP